MIAVVLALLALGCGDDSVVEQPSDDESPAAEIVAPETATGRVIETSTEGPENDSTSEPEPEPNRPDPGSSPADSPPDEEPEASGPPPQDEPEPPATERSPLVGQYGLATVDGEGLPAVTDTRPGCRIEVLSGDLAINPNHLFTLSTGTREICDGRVTAEDVWEASGTVRTDGANIRFNGRSGDAFGAAVGSFADGSITIRSISAEGGEEQVDWMFRRR